jgi:hypothetical protein
MDNPRVSLFATKKEIVEGYQWRSIAWQHQQGVPPAYRSDVPDEMKHPAAGQHHLVNEYLENYIRQNQLI